LAVLAKDKEAVMKSLSRALALLREPWEAKTILQNLSLIRQAREGRQEIFEWTKEVERALENRFKSE
jgi:hypothetical protein